MGFHESSNDIPSFLPMSTDGQLYAFQFRFRSLVIYRLEPVPNGSNGDGHSWCRLSQIDNVDTSKCVIFFGYSATPQLISLKDELGHVRVQFDTTLAKWTTFPKNIDRPRFIREIYGMVECSSGVYFIASTLSNESNIVMFDDARGRFKMAREPPCVVSGPLCHVMMSTSCIESLCIDD